MTTPHERDRSLDTWLSASLPRTGAATDACLDGETVAAWLDGGLDASSRQQADAHVSSCARCQALVASVVALESAEAELAEPAPSRWRSWLNWMVPLGAMATAGLALAVWLNVPAPSLRQAAAPAQPRLEPAAPATAEAPSAAASEPGQPPVIARRSQADATPNAAPDAARKSAESPSPVLAPAYGRVAPAPAAGANAERASSGLAATTAAAAAADAAANVAPPPPAVAPAPAAPQARAATSNEPGAAARVATQQDAVVGQAFAARESSGLEVLTPGAQVRWRLSGRVLSRSNDGGASWVTVVAEAPGRLLAGAAPSAAICWAVGESGLVLRSLDGVTFTRVAAPATATLTFVSATSAASAVVGTADGRRFVTADGGTTWQAAP